MDKKTIIIIMLVIILLGIGGIYGYNYIENKAYQQGINDAVLIINQQLLDNLNQNGYIPYVFELNNETYKTNLYLGNVTKI